MAVIQRELAARTVEPVQFLTHPDQPVTPDLVAAISGELGERLGVEVAPVQPYQVEGSYPVLATGQVVDVPGILYMGNLQYVLGGHPVSIAHVNGVDRLVQGRGNESFSLQQVGEMMAKAGTIVPGDYMILGPTAMRLPSGELADVHEEALLRVGPSGDVEVTLSSQALFPTMGDKIRDEVVLTPTDERIVLGDFGLVDLNRRVLGPSILLKIKGGDSGEISLEQAAREAMQANGFPGGVMVALASDTKVLYAHLTHVPDRPLVSPEDFSGIMTVDEREAVSQHAIGIWSSNHKDREFQEVTGRSYRGHIHGASKHANQEGWGMDSQHAGFPQYPDMITVGGHVNGTFLGPKSRVYLALFPTVSVVQVAA